MGLVRNENTEASGLKQTNKKKLRIESISKLVQNWGVRSSPACTSKTHHSREEGRKGAPPHTHSQCPRCRKVRPWTNGNKPSSPLRRMTESEAAIKLLPSDFTGTMNLRDTSVQTHSTFLQICPNGHVRERRLRVKDCCRSGWNDFLKVRFDSRRVRNQLCAPFTRKKSLPPLFWHNSANRAARICL